jgi:membrane protein implicated in regulation of membrane protease activity
VNFSPKRFEFAESLVHIPRCGPTGAAPSSWRNMTLLYLGAFIAGLLLAVRVMMYGVEKPRDENPNAERSFRLSPAVLLALLAAFGIAGYTLTRLWRASDVKIFVVAAVAGTGAAIAAAYLVRKWWSVTPEHDVDDERYVLQGHIARVTKSIRTDVDGEVTYELGNQRHQLKARSFDAAAIAEGTEVVIERIEGDVAYVEAWQEVEKRL